MKKKKSKKATKRAKPSKLKVTKRKLLNWFKKLKNHTKSKLKTAKKQSKQLLLEVTKKFFKLVNFLLSSAKLLILAIFFIFAMLFADKTHVKYLENKVGSNTVYLQSMPDSNIQGSGTGFQMQAKSGKVVTITNAHVCELANDKGMILVEEKRHSKRLLPKRVLEVYENNDLCVVEGLSGYEGLSLGDEAEIGQPVYSFGYPLGEALHFSEGRVKDMSQIYLVDSSVTSLDQCTGPRHKIVNARYFFFVFQVCVKAHDSIQTSLVIFGGSSGSPMVNIWGNVVGVIFAGNTRTNWGSAVPLKDLKELLKAY